MHNIIYKKANKDEFSIKFWYSSYISIYHKYSILIFTFWSYNSKIDIEKTSIYECGFSLILNQELHLI